MNARLALFTLFLGLFSGCTKTESAPNSSEQIVDPQVMAFLSMARSRHHEANIDEDNGDTGGAVGALTALTSASVPHPDKHIPEVDEVLADTYARIAELEVGRGNVDAASKAIDSGLVLATTESYFRGHLIELRGIVFEARANQLADAGQLDAAANARKQAIEQLHESIRIQEAIVLQKTEAGP